MDSLTIALAIILSIGLTQGIVFAAILWRKSGEGLVANKFKSIFLLVLSYGLLNQVLRLFGIGRFDTWYHLTLDLNWSYGVLIFFYVRAQITQNFRLKKSDVWYFLPVLIQIICSVFVRSQNFYWDGTRESLSWLGFYGYVYWMNYPFVPIIASLLIVFFSFKSLRLLSNVGKDLVVLRNYQWVRNLVRAFGLYYVVVLAILVVDLTVYTTSVSKNYFYFTRFYYYPFFIGMAFLIYWFGLSNLFRQDQRVLKIKRALPEAERQQLEKIAQLLEAHMQTNQSFKNPELTLAGLATELDTKPYLVTKTLNDVLNKSFTDYVNEFRVKEIKRLISNPENKKYTLLSLAFDSGFNSKSSFNRAVKKHLGVSPSELKAED